MPRYIAAAALSAVVFVIVGYFVFAVPAGAQGSLSFRFWLTQPIRFGVYWWVAIGFVFGPTLLAIRDKR